MKYVSGFLLLSFLLLSACGDSSSKPEVSADFKKTSYTKPLNTSTQPIKNTQLSSAPLSIAWLGEGKRIPDKVMLRDPHKLISYVNGKVVKHDNEPLEQFLANYGTITFRKGKDFFADWSMELDVKGLKPNATIALNHASGMINIRKKGEKLPKTHFLKDAQGIIKTGKLTELGMPIQVGFSTREKPFMNKPVMPGSFIVSGKAFATIGDIQIKDGKLDKHYDSTSTIIVVAKEYLKQLNQEKLAKENFSVQHVEYSSDKNKKGEMEGFEGLVVLKKLKGNLLYRVHMLKQPAGWQGAAILKPWKLLYPEEGKIKRSSDRMKVLVSKKVESFLKRKKIKNHIDSTVSCSYSKTMALCTAKISLLKNDNDKVCSQKAYWFKKKDKHYTFIKEVNPEMDMVYVNKKHVLAKSKRKVKSLKDYVLDKSTGLMIGKCGMF